MYVCIGAGLGSHVLVYIGAEEGQEVEWQFHDGVQVGGGNSVHCQPRIHQPGLSVHPPLHLTPSPHTH